MVAASPRADGRPTARPEAGAELVRTEDAGGVDLGRVAPEEADLLPASGFCAAIFSDLVHQLLRRGDPAKFQAEVR